MEWNMNTKLTVMILNMIYSKTTHDDEDNLY